MRLLKGTLPTELDMNETGMEIQLLRERSKSLLPQLREVFQAQVKSAENQLRIVRAELGSPRAKSSSSILKKLVIKRWERLGATLMMAEAYCS